MEPALLIARNLAAVRERIAHVAARSGRNADEITLVGVTKYVGAAAARALFQAGCHELGESRPQELWVKALALRELPVSWHLIGHLQRNKVRRTLPLVSLIHSVDSLALAEAVNVESGNLEETAAVLLEVKIAADVAKHGFAPDELPAALGAIARMRGLMVRGLMAMASLEGGEAAARRDFCRLRTLRDRLVAECPDNVVLDELSMGMSGDYEAAIAEGATIIRIGSALFEGLT